MTETDLVLKLAHRVGGRKPLAEEIGVEVSAVGNWIARGRVGAKSREKFRALALQHSIRLPERWLWQKDAA